MSTLDGLHKPVQYTPQELVDQLHATNFASLYAPGTPIKQRQSEIKLAKQKMRQVKKALTSEQSAIKKQWDGRNENEAAIEAWILVPYRLVEMAFEQVETSIAELEHAVEFNTPLPNAPKIGRVLTGGEEFSAYVITENEETAEAWREGEREKAREEQRAIELAEEQERQRRAERDKVRWREQTKADMELARGLIQDERYDEAIEVLRGVTHPTGLKWMQKAKELAKKQAQARKQRRLVYLLLFAALSIAVVFFVIYSNTQASNARATEIHHIRQTTTVQALVDSDAKQPSRTFTSVPRFSTSTPRIETFSCPSNCTQARALGLSASQAAACGLDRDGDGVACYGD